MCLLVLAELHLSTAALNCASILERHQDAEVRVNITCSASETTCVDHRNHTTISTIKNVPVKLTEPQSSELFVEPLLNSVLRQVLLESCAAKCKCS